MSELDAVANACAPETAPFLQPLTLAKSIENHEVPA